MISIRNLLVIFLNTWILECHSSPYSYDLSIVISYDGLHFEKDDEDVDTETDVTASSVDVIRSDDITVNTLDVTLNSVITCCR